MALYSTSCFFQYVFFGSEANHYSLSFKIDNVDSEDEFLTCIEVQASDEAEYERNQGLVMLPPKRVRSAFPAAQP